MFARIKELYDIDFKMQIQEIEGRISELRPRRRKAGRKAV